MVSYRGYDLIQDAEFGLCIRKVGQMTRTKISQRPVEGTWEYYIESLYPNREVVAETPRKLLIRYVNEEFEREINPESPLAEGCLSPSRLQINGRKIASGDRQATSVRWHNDEDNL